MGTTTISILPSTPKTLYVDWWRSWGYFTYYKTITSTEESKLQKATLSYKILLPTSLIGEMEWWINDVFLLSEGKSGELYFERDMDVTSYVRPRAGEVGTAGNKFELRLKNTNYPTGGCEYTVEYATLTLEYTGEPPELPEETYEQTGGTGPFSMEELNAMLGVIVNFMIIMTVMNITMEVVRGIGGK
jgi:hypothetical protein